MSVQDKYYIIYYNFTSIHEFHTVHYKVHLQINALTIMLL